MKIAIATEKKKNIFYYDIATLSLSENMKDKVVLKNILNALERVAKNLPVILIAHAQTLKQIKKSNGNALRLRVENKGTEAQSKKGTKAQRHKGIELR